MPKRVLKITALALALTVAFTAGVFAAGNGVNVFVNGKNCGSIGFIQDGKLMVTLDDMVRALGGTLNFNQETGTANVNLPQTGSPGGDLKDSCSIKVTKITEGIDILVIAGEVTNTGKNNLTSLSVQGKFFDSGGRELTRTNTYSPKPAELAPGQTGIFEVIFLDYQNYKDKNAQYGIYVQGFAN